MKTTAKFLGLTLVFALLAIPAFADHHEGGEGHGGEMGDMNEMMAAMQELATPGDCHKTLGATVGTFDVKMKMYPAPGAPAMESTGTSEGKWILGNRFVETNYSAEVMGQDFQGHALDGYDNQTKKYTGVWVDNMGTYTLVFKGECDPESKSRSMTANIMDPMGNKMKNRGVTTATDTGYTYESYIVTDQGEFKNLELFATRK
ncbi:MAG: DUF1579 family protein [Acidobacteriota bacterium]